MAPLFIICGAMGALASLVALFICAVRRIPAKKSMLCVKGFSITYILGSLLSGEAVYAFLAMFGIVGFFVALIALLVAVVMKTSKETVDFNAGVSYLCYYGWDNYPYLV